MIEVDPKLIRLVQQLNQARQEKLVFQRKLSVTQAQNEHLRRQLKTLTTDAVQPKNPRPHA